MALVAAGVGNVSRARAHRSFLRACRQLWRSFGQKPSLLHTKKGNLFSGSGHRCARSRYSSQLEGVS